MPKPVSNIEAAAKAAYGEYNRIYHGIEGMHRFDGWYHPDHAIRDKWVRIMAIAYEAYADNRLKGEVHGNTH